MRGWTSLFSRFVGRQAEASTSGRCGKGTTAGFTSLSAEGEAPYNPARTIVREGTFMTALPIVKLLL